MNSTAQHSIAQHTVQHKIQIHALQLLAGMNECMHALISARFFSLLRMARPAQLCPNRPFSSSQGGDAASRKRDEHLGGRHGEESGEGTLSSSWYKDAASHKPW